MIISRERYHAITVKLRKLQELPPLPQTAQRLLALFGDEDCEIEDVAKTIEECPAVTARVIGLAGSAYFAQTQPVRSVEQAIIRVLGLQTVKSLSLSMAVSDAFDPSRCPAFNIERYWGSALFTATLCRLLAGAVQTDEEPVDPEGAYLCGLLHNLGVLALTHVAPQEMQAIFTTTAKNPERGLAELTNEQLGLEHYRAGAWVSSRWHLPPEVTTVIEHYREHTYRGRHWPLALLVGFASRWTQQLLVDPERLWHEPDAIEALGIPHNRMEKVTAQTHQRISEISELTKVFAGTR